MVAFIIGLSIGVMMDFVVKGLKWVCEKSVDLYFDWNERKAKKKEQLYKQPVVGEKLKPKVAPGSYATGGDMDLAQKDRTKTWFEECNEIPKEFTSHVIEPATGYNEPAPTQKSKLLFYQGWRICSHKTSTLEHPDGRLMKVDTATLWEIRELTRVEREKSELTKSVSVEMPMERVVSPSGKAYYWPDVRHPDFKKSFAVGTDLPKGEPMYWDGSKLTDMPKDIPKGEPVESGAYRFKVPVANMTAEEVADFKSRFDASMNAKNQTRIFLWPSNTGFTKLRNRGRRFLPSSNPIGDTAAFMRRGNEPWMDGSHRSLYTPFRHLKGGRRG
jgi:hypothetical protein